MSTLTAPAIVPSVLPADFARLGEDLAVAGPVAGPVAGTEGIESEAAA